MDNRRGEPRRIRSMETTSSDLSRLQMSLLDRAPDEGAAFLAVEPSGSRLVLRSYRVFERSDLEGDGYGELTLTESAQIDGLAAIKRGGHGLVEVHSHPGAGNDVRFSSFDDEQLPRFARYFKNKVPGRSFGALVFGSSAYEGRIWVGDAVSPLRLVAVGEHLNVPTWTEEPLHLDLPDHRFDRQVRALGPRGQRALSALRVGVIGLGGTGSQVSQQLAHLGVRELVLVDDDRVEFSNLARLAGGTWRDAVRRRRKTTVARRYIRRLRRTTRVRVVGNLRSYAALSVLGELDLIVGCVDNDGARLVLTELAAAHLVPYVDIGVGIEGEQLDAVIGGRVSFYVPGGPCLACADELDFGEVTEDLESHARKAIRIERGYARDRTVEPALMPLNTVLVGLAMTEVLAYVTGLRPIVPFYRYDLVGNRLTEQNVEVASDCVVCKTAQGMGDRHGIERYAIGI
jgi:molybdopterin/thiamine biosynthesis adenylyltransferase